MKICSESFPITGTYYGLFPRPLFLGLELKPVFRRDYSFRTVGPIETKPALEETSWVIYEKSFMAVQPVNFLKLRDLMNTGGCSLKRKSLILNISRISSTVTDLTFLGLIPTIPRRPFIMDSVGMKNHSL